MPIPPHDERPGRPETQRGVLAITDDLPHDIPVTDEEVRVLDAWFGNFLDAFWGLED
jgi:hypothetical protein